MMDSATVVVGRMRAVQAVRPRHRFFAVTLDQGTALARTIHGNEGGKIGAQFQADT